MKEITTQARPVGRGAMGVLGMPLQAAPIDRTPAGAAAASRSGVDASWGWLKDIADIALPLAQQLLR